MAGVYVSGFWGADGATGTITPQPPLDRIRRLTNKAGYRATRALINALVGAAPGGTVTSTHNRVGHKAASNGLGTEPGVVVITTVTDINRASTAADVAAIKEFAALGAKVAVSFPADRSGNGGPALTMNNPY